MNDDAPVPPRKKGDRDAFRRAHRAGGLTRWTVTSGALRDLPLIIENLRAVARQHRAQAALGTRRAS
jgi:hypothetical protein